MGKEDEDDLLPDKDAAKGFYAKYEPKEILGRGISSTVRRCIEKETGREFAAKIIDLGADAVENGPHQMLEATRQEIFILRQVIGHPYIIDLQDVFESDAFVFLVFELCPKGELFDHLTSVVTLSEKKTRTIMRQVFEGVDYIHAKNIVHRDLKPENILLSDSHDVKITDFGFARKLEGGQKLFDLCGTPGYLAPETLRCSMFEGSPGYSREVDIWACGVIMFTLLVGCPPFWHRKQMVMLRNIMEGKYSFTSPEWADISEDPKDLIRKCLVVDPTQRITVKQALKHPFFNQMLFDQEIAPLKRSLSIKSRRFSRISDLALNNSYHNCYGSANYNYNHNNNTTTTTTNTNNTINTFSPEKRHNNILAGRVQKPSLRRFSKKSLSSTCNNYSDSPNNAGDESEDSPSVTYVITSERRQLTYDDVPAVTNLHPCYCFVCSKSKSKRGIKYFFQATILSVFGIKLRKQSRFNAKKKFQFAILVVRAMIRIKRLRYTAEPLQVDEAIRDPYRVKVLRKVIDGCAFRVYGHWVKKGEGQNRAALFENTARTELYALYINNLNR